MQPKTSAWSQTNCVLCSPKTGHTLEGFHLSPAKQIITDLLTVWKRSVYLWLSAFREQSTVFLLCIHLSWPHFLSTFQASQYFMRVLREMYSIIFTIWHCEWMFHIKQQSQQLFLPQLFSATNEIIFYGFFIVSCLWILVNIQGKCNMIFRKWFTAAMSLSKCLYLLWIWVTKKNRHKRWHVDECAVSKMTSYEFLQVFPPSTHKAHMHTHSEDALYRSSAYLLAEHHTPSPHTTCLRPPWWAILLSTETGRYRSSLLLLHVCWSTTHQPRRHNTHSAPWERLLFAWSASKHAVSRWHGHMFIPFIFPLWRNSLSLHLCCDWGFLSLCLWCACLSVWFMTFWHFINIIEEGVGLAPESPYSDVCVTVWIRGFMCILTQVCTTLRGDT